MPITRCFGNPESCAARNVISSSGFVTTMRIASGECSTTDPTTARRMPAFLSSRSIRLIPGCRGKPRGDDHDVRARGVRVIVGPPDRRLEALERRGFPHVQGQPLRKPLDDVDHHDVVGQPLLGDPHGRGGADESASNDGDAHEQASSGRA